MLDTLQRRQFRKRDGHTVIFKFFCFRNMYYLRLPCSARFSNGDFSYRGKLTITGNRGDTHFSSLNPRHSDHHIFHSNGSR